VMAAIGIHLERHGRGSRDLERGPFSYPTRPRLQQADPCNKVTEH
jgi:hypothetical protein